MLPLPGVCDGCIVVVGVAVDQSAGRLSMNQSFLLTIAVLLGLGIHHPSLIPPLPHEAADSHRCRLMERLVGASARDSACYQVGFHCYHLFETSSRWITNWFLIPAFPVHVGAH